MSERHGNNERVWVQCLNLLDNHLDSACFPDPRGAHDASSPVLGHEPRQIWKVIVASVPHGLWDCIALVHDVA